MTKTKRKWHNVSRQFLLIVSPFFIMWLWLGLAVSPAVFTPWRNGHQLSSLDKMTMASFAIIFPIAYLALLALSRVLYGKIGVASVAPCSLIAGLVTLILTPIP